MKYPHSTLIPLLLGVIASAGFSQSAATRPAQKPIIMTPPAIPDGSNWSRAPFPAQRPHDDVKGPDGQAIDNLPPNTPSTNIEPEIPAPRVALFQTTTPAYAAEPALVPTGRPTVVAYTGTTAATRGAQKPIVMTPPAFPDGSNWSRAPFPAQRPHDDVKGPDGQAIDNLPPNTPSTNIEPEIPAPRVAIFQPVQPTATVDATLLPTGRVSVAMSMDATNVAQQIRAGTAASREQVLNDIEARLSASERTLTTMSSSSDLNAEVKARARALRKSIDHARSDWSKHQSQLAADYEAYAAALARVDAANGIR